jgi:hypothetical protein
MKISKKLSALALAGAVVAGVLGGTATVASAAEIPGTITITPTTGSITADPFLQSLAVNAPCPTGSVASITSIVQNEVRGNISIVRNTSSANPQNSYGYFGFAGENISVDRVISDTNNYVSNKSITAALSGIADGAFELRVYCFTSATTFNYATAPYFALDMQVTGTTWSILAAAIPTTVSLTAGATGSAVDLAATVKLGDGSTASAAAGNVVFKEGTTTVATVPVAAGLAGAQLTGVADGAHSYTAEYVPTGLVHSGSVSGAANVQVGGIQATSTINVTIPNNVGALTLTGVSTSVNLGTATLSGGTLNASGTLNAVVTDSRQLGNSAWSLTGQVGDFVAGSTTLDGKYLGWTPAVTGASTSTAGAAVVGGTGSGLKTISELAAGLPTDGQQVTNASAELLLKAPSSTRAGAYAATLTLTLI